MSQQHISWSKQEQKTFTESGYWQSESLGELLQTWADQYGDKTAIIDKDVRFSYHQLNTSAQRIAAGLYKLGIRDGDRVLIQLPNCHEFVSVCFALFRLGALPILSLPAQRESDISALCEISGAVAYVVANRFLGFDYLKMAEKLQSQHACLQHVIVVGEAGSSIPLSSLEVTPIDLPLPAATDTALLLLSGGTTGTPKLIPRTHADYAYNATASAALCRFDKNTVYLAALPIAHNFPLACPGILGTLGVGGTVVMAKTPGSDEAFSLIEKHKVTATSLVPPIVQLWLTAKEWDTTDISSLQLLQVGGSRFETELAKQVTPVLGCKLQQVFGMAEGLLCYTRLDDPQTVILNTQGRPLCPHDEIRIVDHAGETVTLGDIGELHTKGPYTLRGYFRADAHNAQTFTSDNFYRTGDLVRMEESGNLIVEGRIKEQINRAGEKIAVAEVENALNQHPQIEKSILVPIPNASLGEHSCAFIIMSAAPALSLQDIHKFLNTKGMPRYKFPDQLEHVIAWPLTAIGKIDKKTLIARAIVSFIKKPIDKETQQNKRYSEQQIKVTADPMEMALKLSQSGLSDDYAIYEHQGEWAIGLGKFAVISADKEQAWLSYNDTRTSYRETSLCAAIATATLDIPVDNWRAYGTAKFEMCHVFHDIETHDKEPLRNELLQLFVPKFEVRIKNGTALARCLDTDQLASLVELLKEIEKQCLQTTTKTNIAPIAIDIESYRQNEYQNSVKHAVREIKSGLYQKVILSRRVPLPQNIDLQESYRIGRHHNTPARSFVINIDGAKMAGFSPETVVEVNKDGWVSTQPLAGTRSLGVNSEEENRLKQELLSDTKEVAEHAVSVKLAQEELTSICDKDSIAIIEFMAVRRRGSVQHLASRVKGKLMPDKNAWDAFESLFPAVTASGIPKKQSIEAIHRHEPEKRGWYSGCVMILDSEGSMDAALVLRSIYQQGNDLWLQAGAGIVDQSHPERELQETIEKLSCISQHLRFYRDLSEEQKDGSDSAKSNQEVV